MVETLPALLAANAQQSPRAVALRQKRLGIWHEMTWAEYHRRVVALAAGLLGMGLQAGDVVALAGGHRAQWPLAELAVLTAGGIVAPIFDDASAAELAQMVTAVGARM